ncbi:unnamed protein product, partial [marine sediment metagenome]
MDCFSSIKTFKSGFFFLAEIESTEDRYMIKWHGLIAELVKQGEDNNLEIRTNHEVNKLIFANNKYSGVSGFSGKHAFHFQSDLIILADGCENPLINKYGIQTPEENCPILTISADDIHFDGNYIELFFTLGEETPPGVIAVFPRSDSSASVDYVQFVGNFKEIHEKYDNQYWWDKLWKKHPVFSDRFKKANIIHFNNSFLPFGGPNIESMIPKERIFLVGIIRVIMKQQWKRISF